MKKLVFLGMALFLCFALVVPAQASLSIGDEAPDFTLEDVYGNSHSLSDFAGYVVMINWWATY